MIFDVTGLLLAGGKSRRMGTDKRFLHVGDRTLFERTLHALRIVFPEVVVVIAQDSEPLDAPVPVLRDVIPNCGTLGGLFTGLKLAKTPYVFVVACDMPFLEPRVIEAFIERRGDADVLMAKAHGLQPMHAVYGKRCLPVMEDMLKTRELRIQHIIQSPLLKIRLLEEQDLQQIDPSGKSFVNVNTPSDLEVARTLETGQDNPRIR
ncbi:molybdenum cofactor guanylyltransferase [Petrachloros mirabilis]